MKKEEALNDKIQLWLETQGYDTEMRVAASLRKAGFGALQAFYYDDPETKISREIDVITRITDRSGLLYIYPVIECKKSQKPWIAFTSSDSGFNRVTSFAVTAESTRKVLAENIEDMIKIDWFRKDKRIAHGITEAFTTKEDRIFKAGVSATKAAIALSQSKSFDSPGLSFFFPTVVLNGQLFECYLHENGNSVVNQISSVFLHFQIKFGNQQGSCVNVVTLEAFDEYCGGLGNTFSQLKQLLKAERQKQAVQIGINPEHVED